MTKMCWEDVTDCTLPEEHLVARWYPADEVDKEIERLKKEVDRKVEIAVLEANRDHEEIHQLRKVLMFYAQGLTEEDEGIECGKYGSKAREALKE